jgi:hypothetical protein
MFHWPLALGIVVVSRGEKNVLNKVNVYFSFKVDAQFQLEAGTEI